MRRYLPFLERAPYTAEELAELFSAWQAGDEDAKKKIEPYVYAELRRLAIAYMRKERRDHTLQVTGLLHEAMTRLAGSPQVFADQQHYYATAARIMRHVLVDHAKARRSTKRGGGAKNFLLTDSTVATSGGIDVVELDDALRKLEQLDQGAARAIELHYFGGLTLQESAEVLGVSTSTISRDIRLGRSWLRAQLYPEKDDHDD